MSDAPPGYDQGDWSRACAGDAHQECGHVAMGTRRRVSPARLQSTIVLCRCSCHAACPLAGRTPVSLTVWQQLCPCPGGERQRAWKEDPDEPWPGAKEAWERQERRSRARREARKEAFEAAREAAPGKSREEIKDLYVAELWSRGQDVPPGPLLEAEIDALTGHPLRGLWKMWKARSEPFRDV